MSGDELEAIVQQWLRFAEEDLAAALRVVDDGHPSRHACWAAQQAAEKAIKARLLQRGVPFPRTHALRVLNELLPIGDRMIGCDAALNELSEWAVESRYPGPWPEATADDATTATHFAATVVATMRRLIRPMP